MLDKEKRPIARLASSPAVRDAAALLLFAGLALCSHAVFLPQFLGLDSAAFTYFGGDSTSQLIPAISLLERSLLDGNLFWSWEYGLGGDLYSEFSYYYTTSPFFYLQFAVKALLGVAGGDFYTTQQWRLVFSIVKETICMLAMFALLRQEKHRRTFAVCGAVIYGCSYWFIDNSFAFDFMTDAMIWPPLVVMAFNRFQRQGSWLPLLLTVSLSIANSFYFGYVNCIFYILLALIFSCGADTAGSLAERLAAYAKRLGKLACITAAALALAAVAFLPSVSALFAADRTQTSAVFDWLPSLDFIKVIPEALFFKGAEYSYLDLQTFAFPLAIMLAVLVNYRKANPQTRRKTILAASLLLLWTAPVFSSIMNGFSYPSNRWCYLVVFAVAYAFPNWMEALIEQERLSAATVGAFAGIVVLFAATHNWRTANAYEETGYVFPDLCGSDILLLALGIAFVIGLWLVQRQKQLRKEDCSTGNNRAAERKTAPPKAETLEKALMGGILCVFLGASVLAMPYGPYACASGFRNNGGVEQFDDPEELALLFEGDEATRSAYEQASPSASEFYRTVDEEATRDLELNGHEARFENRSWIGGGYPTTAYNSLITKQVNRWLKIDYRVTSTTKSASQYRGLGNRLFLENAWGVGKKINADENSQLYGYEKTAGNDGCDIWENSNTVGIDLWYDSCAGGDEWQGWSTAQKDAALLQTAVIDEEALGHDELAPATLAETVGTLSLGSENTELRNCTLSGTALSAKENAEIEIALPEQSTAGEYLLSFDLVREDGGSFSMTVNDIPYWSSARGSRWGYPTDSYALAISGTNAIRIVLDEGDYVLSNVALEFSSYELLEQWTSSVNRYSLEDLNIGPNVVSGSISNSETGVLALSIPYDKGWSCLVDGEKAETFEVNGIFTGILLEPGEHQVEFSYENRVFKLGLGISGAAACLIAAAYAHRLRKNKREGGGSPASSSLEACQGSAKDVKAGRRNS